MVVKVTKIQTKKIKEFVKRKQQIIKEASKLFIQKGYAYTSIRDIAEACGINLATLYYHVGSKQNLLKLFREDTEEAFLQKVQEHVKDLQNMSTHEAIRYAVQLYLSYIKDYPDVTYFWYAESRYMPEEEHKKVVEMDRKFVKILTKVIDKGRSAGEFRKVNAYLTSVSIIHLCDMWSLRQSCFYNLVDFNEYADFVVDFILSALRCDGSS